jgi:outer membrane protein TolC
MKKRVISILLIIATLLSSTIIYADEGNSLDVEKAAIKIIENSGQIKSAETMLKNASWNYAMASRMPGNYLNLLGSEHQANSAQRQKDVIQNSIQFATYSKYIDILKAEYALEIQKKSLELANEANENTKLKYKLNQVSNEQLVQSEGQYNSARLEQRIRERELNGLTASFNALMGEAPTKQYSEYVDNSMIPINDIAALETYTASALTNRAEILDVNEQLNLKTEQRRFTYGLGEVQNNPRHAQINSEIDLLATKLDITVVDIQLELLELYNNMKAAMVALDSAKDAMVEADKDFKSAELKYEMGLISRFDKQEEELAYMKSKYNFRKAQLDAWLSQVHMELASGLGL